MLQRLARRTCNLAVVGLIPDHAILELLLGKRSTPTFHNPLSCKMVSSYSLWRTSRRPFMSVNYLSQLTFKLPQNVSSILQLEISLNSLYSGGICIIYCVQLVNMLYKTVIMTCIFNSYLCPFVMYFINFYAFLQQQPMFTAVFSVKTRFFNNDICFKRWL